VITLGVDVGGTNTDIVLGGVDGGIVVHKLPTTTDDPARATVQGTEEICRLAGIAPADIGLVLHGTTVATNALLEHDGGRTGMLTTEGFRDIIHIGRHQRPHNFSLMQDIPFQRWPLVERKHRRTVRERVIPPGVIETPLDEERCVEAILELRAAGIESICVCFLFSFLDPSHEVRAGELIAEHHPDAEVSLSHEVVAQFREFERFTTTAANAYLKPKTRRYLEGLAGGWRDVGVRCPILVMQSNGGVAEIGQAAHHAVNLLLSGPAAGVIAGRHVGTANGHEHLITLDIGGTSADISVIPGRLLEMDARDSRIGGYPILTPKLDVTAIGAGGGSIAWRDRGGAFNVGPRSAGAVPGPACYGRGGSDPTVTDAHVVLGRIDPARFLEGRLRLHPDAAREAVERIGLEFGLGVEEAALAILAIVNANMVREVRIHSVRRGYDPRECALVAFGGAGPLHACEVAAQLEVPVILVPPAPGITSAVGLLATDLKYDVVRTVGVMLAEADRAALDRAFGEMERDLRARFAAADEPVLRREAACRYTGQGYELTVDCDDLGDDWRTVLDTGFHERHRREYGFAFPGDPVEVINLRVTATAAIPTRPQTSAPPGDGDPRAAVTGRHTVIFGDAAGHEAHPVTTYDRDALRANDAIPGPAIVHEMDSTVVISPGWDGVVLPDGTIRLEAAT
jgi:N-methylhydantoinase A